MRDWLKNRLRRWLGIEDDLRELSKTIDVSAANTLRELDRHTRQLENLRRLTATHPLEQKPIQQMKSWRDTLAFIGDPDDGIDNPGPQH